MPEDYETHVTAAQLQKGDLITESNVVPSGLTVVATSPKRVKTTITVSAAGSPGMSRSYDLRLEDTVSVVRTRPSKADELERDLHLIRGYLWSTIEQYEVTKAKFEENFAIDPEYAIVWLAESVVAAKTAAEWAANVVHAYGVTGDLVAVLKESVKRLTSQVLSDARRGGSRSSSTATNMCDAATQQARAKILDDYRLQYIVSAY